MVNFAALQTRCADAVLAHLANARLTDGARTFDAILSREVYDAALYADSADTRYVMTVAQADYDGLGDSLMYDPETYSPEWIAAQVRYQFRLGKVESRDGNLVKVWLE